MIFPPSSSTIIYLLLFFFGIMIGNLLTTMIHRLPRNISLNGIFNNNFHPFCSTCKHPLKFYEYFPILSWIFSGRSCNYCGAKIPLIYTIVEVITGLAIPITYAVKCQENWGQINCQIAIITAIYSICTILSIALYIVSRKIYSQIIISTVWLGLIKQALITNCFDEHATRLMIVSFSILLACKKNHSLLQYALSIGAIAASWSNDYLTIISILLVYTLAHHHLQNIAKENHHREENVENSKNVNDTSTQNISSITNQNTTYNPTIYHIKAHSILLYPSALLVTYMLTAW